MGDNTEIEWTDATWNPIVGCSIVSPGCTNCYAMKMAARIEKMNSGSHYDGTTRTVNGKPVWTGKMALAPDHILTAPLRWKKPRRIFVNSMSDLFHESVLDEWIDRVFAVMALCPQHTFQMLTKRSKRMREYMTTADQPLRIIQIVDNHPMGSQAQGWLSSGQGTLPNVHLGVSAEDQTRADERIPDLLKTPAAVRWVSAEPLLGPIDFRNIDVTARWNNSASLDALDGEVFLPGAGSVSSRRFRSNSIDWIIVGGESGPSARPMHPDWVRSIRDQCKSARIPFFFKQWGEWAEHHPINPSRGDGIYLDSNGALMTMPLGGGYDRSGINLASMKRIGKARAGHLLDGVAHREFPG